MLSHVVVGINDLEKRESGCCTSDRRRAVGMSCEHQASDKEDTDEIQGSTGTRKSNARRLPVLFGLLREPGVQQGI
jgi:hypothetical protein